MHVRSPIDFLKPYQSIPNSFLFKVSCFVCFILMSCGEKKDETLFQQLNPADSGIDFANPLTESDSFNIVDFDYIYNGAGLGIADLNGDQLPDIFFGGNQVSSKLYLNRGELKFEEITETAGVATSSWIEGVTFVDINSDGKQDIYLSVSNREGSLNPNLLFVNQGVNEEGIPTFKEQAAAYGLDQIGYFTQATFLDYDRDGDLDCYLLANALEEFQRNISRPRITDGTGKSNDLLLNNDGNGRFTNVSADAGVLYEGYGLGLVVTDVNQDGWPDLYIANDFLSNDILYVNQQDGTFRNEIHSRLDHQSFNAMGADAGDINGDGWPDIVVVDMFPPDNFRQKTMFSPTENYNLYQANLSKGYEPQYVRNTLQLNRGDGTFAEIGELAGISQTDWSWSPLFADFDLDGKQDLIISNGYGKDITDLDYINYTNNLGPFMTPEEKKKLKLDGLNLLKGVKLKNYAFRNQGDLSFEDVSFAWGFEHAEISNGMAYADLDGDGDFDLVTNNLNQEAGIYRNNVIRGASDSSRNWIKIRLNGSSKNPVAIGASVRVFYRIDGESHQVLREHNATRGYKSAMVDDILIGTGTAEEIDSVRVTWPDGTVTKMGGMKTRRIIDIKYAGSKAIEIVTAEEKPLYKEVSKELGIDWKVQSTTFNDFNRQILLHQKHSELGPALAVADVNGDGLDDFYVSGAVGSAGQLFIQRVNGKFRQSSLPESGNVDEMGVLFFDADLDGDLDLYVVGGGSRFSADDSNYIDSFYLNDGKGNFTKSTDKIPVISTSGSVVTAADYDQDGDLDLFIGGRLVPGRYPEVPSSYLLENRNGTFYDVTASVSAELTKVGMVSDALWTDYDQDGSIDLLVVGEWMPVTVFLSSTSGGNTRLKKKVCETEQWQSEGWWNSISPLAFLPKEKPAYALGNAGFNSRVKASQAKPIELYAGDFDGNGSIDPIFFHYLGDSSFPIASRNQLVSQVPRWKNKFLVFREFAKVDQQNFLKLTGIDSSSHLRAFEMRSGILSTSEKGVSFEEFPEVAQFSRVFGMAKLGEDLFFSGNYYGNETVTGRSDAGKGGIIKGINNADPSVVYGYKEGLKVPGEARAVAKLITSDGSELILVSRYNQPLLAFKSAPTSTKLLEPQLDDQHLIFYEEGKPVRQMELFYGDGYLSQSTRKLLVDPKIDSVMIRTYKGEKRTVTLVGAVVGVPPTTLLSIPKRILFMRSAGTPLLRYTCVLTTSCPVGTDFQVQWYLSP